MLDISSDLGKHCQPLPLSALLKGHIPAHRSTLTWAWWQAFCRTMAVEGTRVRAAAGFSGEAGSTSPPWKNVKSSAATMGHRGDTLGARGEVSTGNTSCWWSVGTGPVPQAGGVLQTCGQKESSGKHAGVPSPNQVWGVWGGLWWVCASLAEVAAAAQHHRSLHNHLPSSACFYKAADRGQTALARLN